jgi:hypothetical protein
MTKYIGSSDFLAAAAAAFDFLLGAGFVLGASDGHRLLYASGDFAVEVLYDDRDGRVITLIDAHVDDRNPRANLICLYVEAGLGPAQAIREIARSKKILVPVLESHAAALRALMPVLNGPTASGLFLACHGT